LRISAFVNAAISLFVPVVFNKTQAPELVGGNASHGQGCVIKAAQPVLSDHEKRQLHRHGQVAHEVI
jgi:hypothetical protein